MCTKVDPDQVKDIFIFLLVIEKEVFKASLTFQFLTIFLHEARSMTQYIKPITIKKFL